MLKSLLHPIDGQLTEAYFSSMFIVWYHGDFDERKFFYYKLCFLR